MAWRVCCGPVGAQLLFFSRVRGNSAYRIDFPSDEILRGKGVYEVRSEESQSLLW